MKKSYTQMDEIELLDEIRRRYGQDFDLNDKNRIREAMKNDDGLWAAFFDRSLRF